MITAALIVLLVVLLAIAAGSICWIASGDFWAWIWLLQGGPEVLGRLIVAVIEAISDANS